MGRYGPVNVLPPPASSVLSNRVLQERTNQEHNANDNN